MRCSMNETYNQKLKKNSQKLRKNMTKEERHLWFDFLKGLKYTIKRQQIIGNYIVDFYCASKKIVIELDGSQHYEADGINSDTRRDEYLNSIGIKVLRYSNYDINKNFIAVCEDILKNMECSNE
ncbi:MAG: endonuclease domain-containing protein [Pseudobutyrivibrio ruminis]|uniref:Endonuclease domain-containing protein n=1 Tax=Pseudobutyrivibrio ruminis TaxID=46206 RepID=A0A927U640_9FIRM|nr:endonuclease domain-containing protein [Pseudobutyrivibrio ruminis]